MGVQNSVIGRDESVWVATTPETVYPAFSTAQPGAVDVIVVGGGIAGLTTAYLLQRSGVRVAVVEMRHIVKGVTGYTTAKVTALHTLIYDHLIATFGEEQARMYGEAQLAGLETIANLSAGFGIDCDFKRTDAYTFAQTDSGLHSIEKEVQAAQKLGLPGSFTKTVDLPIPIRGAIRFTNQAQFHPRKYLLGLANAFVAAGGLIFENTHVLNVQDDPPRILTDYGEWSAEYLVIATHYPIYDPALYFSRLAPHRSLVVGAYLNGPVPQGMYIGCEDDSKSFRNQPTPDGDLLLVGGEGYKTGQETEIVRKYESLAEYARAHFPVARIAYHWSTQDNRTIDGVPYIGRIGPGHDRIFVATGFGGWGMTNGTAAGLLLSGQILKQDIPWSRVFDPTRFKPLTSAKPLVTEGLNVAREFIEGYLPKPALEEATTLINGEGRVLHHEAERYAVSRDTNGKLHAVSAVCTHMGCIVAWNNAEQSWDCPCHASRFDPDGQVLHGPATKPLQTKQISSEV